MTEERGDRLRRVMAATGENTKAKALDVAMAYYLTNLKNKRRYATDLNGKMAENFSKPWLPIERETRVVLSAMALVAASLTAKRQDKLGADTLTESAHLRVTPPVQKTGVVA